MFKYFLIIFILIFLWSFLIEPNLLVIKEYKDKELGNIKIVFVSDFHIAKNEKRRLERIVNVINAQEPDLVLSGGDFIKGHSGKNTLPIEEQAEILKKLKAPMITVLGNHDRWYDGERVRSVLEKSGITVLENSNIKFGNLYIAGVEDLQTGFPDIKKALEGTKSPCILLSHSPDIYYDLGAEINTGVNTGVNRGANKEGNFDVQEEKVELILAGHVHGGQICIPFFGAVIVPSKYGVKFAKGLIHETGNKMFITKGLGTSILPFRFCSVPEIVVIN